MKKIISMLCAASIAAIGSISASALTTAVSKTITVDDVQYQYTELDNHIVIDKVTSSKKEIDLPAEINGKAVAELGDHACAERDFTRVSIPDSVNKIGVAAFFKCTALSDIEWDLNAEDVYANAFDETPWLENNHDEFVLFNNGTLLYRYNGNAKDVVIPNTVTDAAEGVFASHAEIESVKIPEGLKYISNFMFDECSSLKSVKLPESIEYIGSGGFGRCSSLTEITIPDSVKNIKEKAFLSCTSLSKVQLPSNLETLGRQAFSKCTALKTINIPSNICSSIERNTFLEGHLENVTIEGKMTSELAEALTIGNWTNGGAEFSVINGVLTSYNGNGGAVVIPDEVTTIGANAFMNKEITSVILPPSLERIDQRAFYGVKGLTEISIPGSVTSIGQMAFAECCDLKTIIFEKGSGSITLGGASFQSTAVTADTLITNDRKLLINNDTAFYNTALENVESPNEVKPTVSPAATAEPTPATTAAPEELTVTAKDDSILVSVSNKAVDFDDAQPFVDENGRTQIPVRAVAEALNCAVDWDAQTQTVTLSKDNVTVIIKIGSADMQAGKAIITMDTTAQIENNRTYIPLRFVGEAFGMKVNWESK